MNIKDPLYDAIVMATRGGITTARLAASAGVSSKTLYRVLEGNYFTKMIAEAMNKSKPDLRKIRGLVKSITRLALYFKLDPQTVADTYGFPQGDYFGAIMGQAATSSPNRKENKPEPGQFDHLLDRPLTQDDIHFIGGVIEKVGGPIPISTALLLLSSRDNTRHTPS